MENEILKNLKRIDSVTSKKRDVKAKSNLSVKTIVHFGFFRALDYSLEMHRKKKPPNESVFLISGLRAICEDLIYIVAISKWSSKDVSEYIKKTIRYQYRKSLEAQHEFFKQETQGLLYFKPENLRSSEHIKKNDFISFWKRNGYSVNNKLPSTFQIAQKNGLETLYRFLYHATSESVHHNLRYLFRMGWVDKNCKDSFHICSKNFSGYYFSFCKFYGIYLLYLYYKHLGSKIGIKKILSKEMSALQKMQETQLRWPEIVTFEEMFIQPPTLFTRAVYKVAALKKIED